MKPVERQGYIDMWILLSQDTQGKFFMMTTPIQDLGNGIFASQQAAQHQQTMELLKGNKCQVYHIEWPL